MDDTGALTLLMNFIAPALFGLGLLGATFLTWRRRSGDATTPLGLIVVVAALALSLAIFVWGNTPSSAPNSGSTSTSKEVDPATTVAPEAPKPGINPGGK